MLPASLLRKLKWIEKVRLCVVRFYLLLLPLLLHPPPPLRWRCSPTIRAEHQALLCFCLCGRLLLELLEAALAAFKIRRTRHRYHHVAALDQPFDHFDATFGILD